MRCIRALFLRLWGLFGRHIHERDLAEEIESNLQLHISDNLRAGLTHEDARRKALLKLGGIEKTKEEYRDRRSIPALETLVQDVRYGLRQMGRSPGFTTVAVLSLGLGIGANTAVFSVINALTFRQLPLKNPNQVVAFHITGGSDGSVGWSRTSYRWFEWWRDRTEVFSDISATCLLDRFNITIHGPGGGFDPGQVRVELVSGNYFSTMGVDIAIGRPLTPDDNREPGGHPVAVISDGYWSRRFARSPGAIGRTLTLNGTTYTILGVTPPGFSGEWVGRPVDLWIPIMMQPQLMPEETGGVVDPWGSSAWVRIVARIKPDVSLAAAQTATTAVFQQIWREWAQHLGYKSRPDEDHRRIELLPAAEGYSDQRQPLSRLLAILMIVVGLVLLIACSNVAHLLLSRCAVRQREMAVRLAIGAGSARLVRQLLTESLLLSVMAGALGLLAAQWGTKALLAMVSSGPAQRASILARSSSLSISLDLHPDGRVLAFTAAICLLTGILFGLTPAFRSTRISLSPALRGCKEITA
jgi:predicted permease